MLGWCAEPQQGFEGGVRGDAPVVTEVELLQVDGQGLVRDAAVGAVQPCLEVRHRTVSSRQELLAGSGGALAARTVGIPECAQAVVAQREVATGEVRVEARQPFDALRVVTSNAGRLVERLA